MFEDEAGLFDASTCELTIEEKFRAWQEDHRECRKRQDGKTWAVAVLVASILGSILGRYLQ